MIAIHASPSSSTPAGALSFFAPKLYAWLASKLAQLFNHHADLKHNFKNSIYPAVTFNCGPATACLEHTDFGNVAGGLCAVTSLGNYNPKQGGHLVLFSLRLVVEFPPGSTIFLPSSTISHGNTPIQDGESRLSITQYCAGGLIRWVDYGFQAVKSLLSQPGGKAKKAETDGLPGSRWQAAMELYSKFEELDEDRRRMRQSG